MSLSRPSTLLLIEDNLADIKITQRAFEAIGARVDLLIARNGQQAMTYLLRQGRFAENPPSGDAAIPWKLPDLILLDLNLPGVTGLDLLKEIREMEQLRLVPILVLTTSPRAQDVTQAYAAGANTYFEKPRNFDDCVELMRIIQRYWLELALLP